MLNSFNKKLKSLTQSNRYGTLTHSQRAVFSRHGNASGEGLLLLSPIFGHHRQPAEAVGHLESRIGYAGALRRERRFRGARLGPVVFLGLGGVGEPLSEKEQDISDGLPAQHAPVPGSGDLLAIVHFREILLKDAGHLVGDDQRGGARLPQAQRPLISFLFLLSYIARIPIPYQHRRRSASEDAGRRLP